MGYVGVVSGACLLRDGHEVTGVDPVAGKVVDLSQGRSPIQEPGISQMLAEGHKAGREREYYQMEKLTNLDKLPPYGFTVSCFPIKILHASAAWVRPVAIVEE